LKSNSGIISFRSLVIAISLMMLFAYSSYHCDAQKKVNVHIFSMSKLRTILTTPATGEYQIYGNDTLVTTLRKNELVYLLLEDHQVKLQTFGKEIGRYNKVELKGKMTNNDLKIKPILPSLNPRIYPDNFSVSVDNNQLRIINMVKMENYIAGTV